MFRVGRRGDVPLRIASVPELLRSNTDHRRRYAPGLTSGSTSWSNESNSTQSDRTDDSGCPEGGIDSTL